ncbi:MAG: 5'/3'-nucleotidase SurE [Fibrobacterota bacterium]
MKAKGTSPEILLTNDDGINAEGLYLLYKGLSEHFRTSVAAPAYEQSGVSQAFTISSPITYTETVSAHGLSCTAINGTPSDCVKFTISKLLKKRPLLVVSGLNRGENSGVSSIYSGTVAAAREGCFFGIPSVAFSMAFGGEKHIKSAVKSAVKIVKKIMKNEIDFDGQKTFITVNFPACSPKKQKGIRFAKQSTAPFKEKYERRIGPNGNEYFWLFGSKKKNPPGSITDDSLLEDNYITVTPHSTDSTDYNTLKQFESAPDKLKGIVQHD